MTRVELPTPFPTPPFPHPLSYPTLPYPTLPYPTLPYSIFPLRLCVFAPLRSILPFASLHLCVFAFNSSLCVLASLRLCVQFFPLRLCVFAFNSFRLPAWPRRMNFANGSHSGKGSSPRPRSVSGARLRAIDRPALGSDRLGLPFAGSG